MHVGQSSLHKVAVDDCLGRQSFLLSAAFADCREPKRAVVLNDINSKLLKPRKPAISHQSSKRGFMTALMVWRAVATDEINDNLLKARKQAVSHLISNWRIKTARVVKRAVATNEINYNLLKSRKPAVSHLISNRRVKTAQVVKRAVALIEISFTLLPEKSGISKTYHHLLLISKKVTAFKRQIHFEW